MASNEKHYLTIASRFLNRFRLLEFGSRSPCLSSSESTDSISMVLGDIRRELGTIMAWDKGIRRRDDNHKSRETVKRGCLQPRLGRRIATKIFLFSGGGMTYRSAFYSSACEVASHSASTFHLHVGRSDADKWIKKENQACESSCSPQSPT